MKALIAIKRVIDPYVNVRVKSDHSGIETTNVRLAINPFDEIAVEEALRLKEKGIIEDILVVSIGERQCQETLRHALALGADRALFIEAEQHIEPLNIAKCLQKIVLQEAVDMVVLGKQSIDGDNNQTGQMLAALLDWPQGTFISELNIENGFAKVTREIDGGLEMLSLQLPAVLTTDLRLNEPRYATLPNIMKAKKKPLAIMPIEELDIDVKVHTKILEVIPPPTRSAGVTVETVAELVDKLKNEAKVI